MSYPYTEESSNYPKAFGIAGGIMGFLLLISFFIMIGSSMPQFGMGGMIVNYGTAEFGMGEDYMTVDEPSMHPNANEIRPDKIDPDQSPDPTPAQQITDRNVVTQDMNDAPAVVSNDTKKTNATQATADKKDSKPAVNPNALYKGKQNNSTGRGDGTSDVAGNQGSELGDPLAANYGEGGSGDGNMGISIANRRWEIRPKIDFDIQRQGVVMVLLRIAPDGRILHAEAGKRGTTINNEKGLYGNLEAAFRGARLNQLERSPTIQEVIIPINFRLR